MNLLSQAAFCTILLGCQYSLLAISFQLIYRTAKFLDFGQAAILTCGPYTVYCLSRVTALPTALTALIGIALSGCAGLIIYLGVYSGVMRRRGRPLAGLLASLGVLVIVQNLATVCFSSNTKTLGFIRVERGWLLLGARITQTQFLIIISTVLTVAFLLSALSFTRVGGIVRAVANNTQLASVSGIPAEAVVAATYMVACALSGFAGMLSASDVGMTPGMGTGFLMMAIVGAVLGGLKSPVAACLGAFSVAASQQAVAWGFNMKWQDAVVFAILLVVLVVRPHGVLGHKFEKAT